MSTVLITGARGTVGGYALSLAEAAGHRVIATDLGKHGIRMPVRGEVRSADLRDTGVLEGLVSGCDYVIHTAARLDDAADPAELTGINTDAVVNLYEAAEAAGAKRFVQVSTATLYAARPGEGLTEEDELSPRGPYGMSKYGAEVFLRGRSEGLPWTVLRPAPIYGRRGRHFAASLLAAGPLVKLVLPVLPRPSGGPDGTMVHAEDVARAALFVLDREDAQNQVFNVSDGDVLPLADRIGITFDAYGIPTFRTGTVPNKLLEMLGRLFQVPGPYHGADVTALAGWRTVVLRHGLRPALHPRLDREAMTLLYEELVVDSQKLRDLGWTPRFPRFAEGWREVLRWYQAERWVPRYA